MKKIVKKTALILVIVMVFNVFTGCLSWYLMTGEWPNYSGVSGEGAIGLIFIPVIDIVLMPVALVVFAIRMSIEKERKKRGEKWDDIDTFSASAGYLTERFKFLPDDELASLILKFDSMPEDEINSITKKINSFSEAKISAVLNAFDNLSDETIAFSVKTLNSMPEEFLINKMNNLQQIKIGGNYEK